jgi:serine/threonine protein kinase
MIPAGQPQRRSDLRIGRYAVIGRIGRGGMGMVYRGYDETLEREIAIKTLTIEGSGDEESRVRFGIEARAAAKLQHPNIVTVYEQGEDRGVSFIAMELLPGIDLESLLRSEEALLLQEKLEIVIQVCRGLAFAHERGVVHRDIKPANIRLLDDGTIKIMDFGIAKVDTTGVTRAGMMVGTLSYMSPEQIQGQTLDGRSDVFSVGVLLYQLLAGERPFPGPGSEVVLYQICHQPTPELAVDLGSAGPRLQGLAARALHKDPAQRIQSAARFADELSQVLDWYSRSAVPPVAEEDQHLLADARRRIRDDPPEETVDLYAAVVERNPHSVEARRALRAANRRLWEADQPQALSDDYPELEATFRAGGTPRPTDARSADTLVQPPTLRREAASSPAALIGGGAVLVVLAIGAAWLMRSGDPPPPGRPPVTAPTVEPGGDAPSAGGPATAPDGERAGDGGDGVTDPRPEGTPATGGDATPVTPLRVRLETQPPGAAVSVDGRPIDGVTPLELGLDRAAAHRIALSLDGYESRTLQLEPGQVPGRLSIPLEAARPPGTLAVSAGYPVEVVWGGRVLAQGERAPQVTLPAGSHSVTLRSSEYFLDYTARVEITAGERRTLQAPGLGRIHIRASPGNCRILIDGVFADYPPISDRAIAAGRHRVSFRWPDGTARDKTVDVETGKAAYVTERQ